MSSGDLRVLFVGLKWPLETFILRLMAGLGRHGIQVTAAVLGRPADEGPGVVVDAAGEVVTPLDEPG